MSDPGEEQKHIASNEGETETSDRITPREGVSPYSTGGGGVTFERKVAVQYLAHLLLASGAIELGDGRSVLSVAFQQAPAYAVDDLVVRAARKEESEPSLVLSLGIRRKPKLIQSDESARKLIRQFVKALIDAPLEGPEHRFALVVAGQQPHAEQLAELAALAFVQSDATDFSNLVHTSGKFTQAIRDRLAQFEGLVKRALIDLDDANPSESVVQQRTWELLARMSVLMPGLEPPNEMDWAKLPNSLIQIARGTDLAGAILLRDRLEALVNKYASKAANINAQLLRRDVHPLLDSTARRNKQGLQSLEQIHTRALTSVSASLGSSDGVGVAHIDRSETSSELLTMISKSSAVVVHGESGVGKSALTVLGLAEAAKTNPDEIEVLCINLHHIPPTALEFDSRLGCSFAILLNELSAPRRILVIDGADAVAEDRFEVFRYLVNVGFESGMKIVAVATNDNKQTVSELIIDVIKSGVDEFMVNLLSDEQVDSVVINFKELKQFASNSKSRDLLRRLVVVNLLVRSGVTGLVLGEADAMNQVWNGHVRRGGKSDRGAPDLRESALLQLAELALTKGDRLKVVGGLDPAALNGLIRDGLLQKSIDDPYMNGPDFAHEEIRKYAVARLLLSKVDLTARIVAAGAPRWSMGAARLACQAFLALPDQSTNPISGRLTNLQLAFDVLVSAGYGERWGDVPGEAVLAMTSPDSIIRDVWSELQSDEDKGLHRLARIIRQRHSDEIGIVKIDVIERIIGLLLEEATPWQLGKLSEDLLRDWLRAHVMAETPAGHALRVGLREQLVRWCADADQRAVEEREAAVAARAARSAEEIEKEREFKSKNRGLFTEIGYSRNKHNRERPEVPREITDEIVIELLALLGPDLGDEGEIILRRVAKDTPWWLAPAVEEILTGRALASYRQGLLADLTAAYYIDEDADGLGFGDRGIRDHHARSMGVTPLAAWYRGPFDSLFKTDLRNGVGVLNRMLNHAARIRVATSTGLYDIGSPVDEDSISDYKTELDITGTRAIYIGDANMWNWYRGTGVGPYPCMSALQALERFCDQLVKNGFPLATLVGVLLEGCENLAMVGLIVGLLVRHLEKAERLLDPYLVESPVWHYEFNRSVLETSGLAASSEGLTASERRNWSLREVAMKLVAQADEPRAAELRAIGDRLVDGARRRTSHPINDESGSLDEATNEEQLLTVRAWASGLDSDTYQLTETQEGIYIQSRPPADVVHGLAQVTEDIHRAQEATKLMVRYRIEPKRHLITTLSAKEFVTDLAMARDLLLNPPKLAAADPWDVAAAVAATALESHFLRGADIPLDELIFAAETVIHVGEREAPFRRFEYEETYFEFGSDRSAARALSLLLLPIAAPLRVALEGVEGARVFDRIVLAATNLAHAKTNEVRLHLARGLDCVWDIQCTENQCHHEVALQVAIETMRDCALGEWDADLGRRQILLLSESVVLSLTALSDDAILFSRLDAAIRALAPAAVADICVSVQARDLLLVLLRAQRRALLANDHDMDSRGLHSLVSSRALLTLAADGNDGPIFEHIDAYADNPTLLMATLWGLSAAAQETKGRALVAQRIWPHIIKHVLGLAASGHTPFRDRHYGEMSLAALMPNMSSELMYREIEGEPIVWWNPGAWTAEIDDWIPLAAGNARCVDRFITFLSVLEPHAQVHFGLSRVAALVLANPKEMSEFSFSLQSWLKKIHKVGLTGDSLSKWQSLIEVLVVSGADPLAVYLED